MIMDIFHLEKIWRFFHNLLWSSSLYKIPCCRVNKQRPPDRPFKNLDENCKMVWTRKIWYEFEKSSAKSRSSRLGALLGSSTHLDINRWRLSLDSFEPSRTGWSRLHLFFWVSFWFFRSFLTPWHSAVCLEDKKGTPRHRSDSLFWNGTKSEHKQKRGRCGFPDEPVALASPAMVKISMKREKNYCLRPCGGADKVSSSYYRRKPGKGWLIHHHRSNGFFFKTAYSK